MCASVPLCLALKGEKKNPFENLSDIDMVCTGMYKRLEDDAGCPASSLSLVPLKTHSLNLGFLKFS